MQYESPQDHETSGEPAHRTPYFPPRERPARLTAPRTRIGTLDADHGAAAVVPSDTVSRAGPRPRGTRLTQFGLGLNPRAQPTSSL
ncbi:hypothetical protein ITP53_15575 [Nonomuraea sp. K274]|uniref:Uncharacterized protein n=1 Tax=Nonomuraea cypriaca TaxID=1187855 RepID=A0A931EZ33_9ACTN|nr:hypothetical protein [Nonomuraea cypriaca]MBF8187132.1 hypothetical protein [Nonomuraea cypriaca]